MKTTTYFTEKTTKKAEKHLFERRNFLCEFTENCFAMFAESSHAIYSLWYK